MCRGVMAASLRLVARRRGSHASCASLSGGAAAPKDEPRETTPSKLQRGGAKPTASGGGLDFAAIPPSALRPHVLLLDATYVATSVAPSSSKATHVACVAATVARLLAATQPSVCCVAAFDSGARKPLVPGSPDARRRAAAARRGGAAAGTTDTASPQQRGGRGDPSRFVDPLAAVGVHTVIAPPGAQGDDVLVSLAHALRHCDGVRCLVVSGDTDAVASLARGPPGPQVDWLRVAPFPCAAWPRTLTHVTWHDFLHKWKFPPHRWPLYGCLVGRPRDGVPKLGGVGPSAAAALLRAFGSDPQDSDAVVLDRMLGAAQAGKLGGYRPEVGAALAAPGARAVLQARLERLQPKLHAAEGAMPAPLVRLIDEHSVTEAHAAAQPSA